MDFTRSYASIFGLSAGITSASLKPLADGCGDHYSVTVTRSVRDIDEDKTRSFVENLLLTPSLQFHSMTPMGMELVKVVAADVSPSGAKTLILRMASEEKQTVEIQAKGLVGSFTLDVSTLHANFVADTWFGGISWSSDERYVIYVAQKTKPKPSNGSNTGSATATSVAGGGSNAAAAPPASEVTGFEYKEDWGERYVDVSELVLVVVDTHKHTAVLVPDIDTAELTVGQPVFVPSDNNSYKIAYTGWPTKPRRLGMIYCYQRPCSVYVANLTAFLLHQEAISATVTATPTNNTGLPEASSSEPVAVAIAPIVAHKNITKDKLKLARSARCSPDGQLLVMLGNISGFDTHSGPTQLFAVDLTKLDDSELSIDLIVDEVEGLASPADHTDATNPDVGPNERILATRGPFPGLFLDSLPRSCFVAPRKVILSTTWGSRDNLVIVDVVAKTVTPVLLTRHNTLDAVVESPTETQRDLLSTLSISETGWNNPEECSVNVLDVCAAAGLVLFSVYSPSMISRLGVYHLHTGKYSLCSRSNAINYFSITKKHTNTEQLAETMNIGSIQWKIMRFICSDGIPMECIILFPRQVQGLQDAVPLIVVPHGGPHGCVPTLFDPSMAYLCLQLQSAIMIGKSLPNSLMSHR
jgi:hypothetical protein